MDERLPALGFATDFLLVVSGGLIVSGYTPRHDDLWIVLPFVAGFVSALIAVAVWRVG